MVAKYTLLKSKNVLTSRVFEVHDEQWRMPDGKKMQRHTIRHPGAVAIVALDTDGRAALVRQFRPATGKYLLEIPAGTLEKGEAPLACAKRELIEEIGFSAKKWKKIGSIYTAPGFCSEIIHLYQAWELSPAHAEQDEDEDISPPAFMTPDELRKALAAGKICDGKTMSGLLCSDIKLTA